MRDAEWRRRLENYFHGVLPPAEAEAVSREVCRDTEAAAYLEYLRREGALIKANLRALGAGAAAPRVALADVMRVPARSESARRPARPVTLLSMAALAAAALFLVLLLNARQDGTLRPGTIDEATRQAMSEHAAHFAAQPVLTEKIRVVGVFFGAALIEDRETGKQDAYDPGVEVHGYVVTQVGADRVQFQSVEDPADLFWVKISGDGEQEIVRESAPAGVSGGVCRGVVRDATGQPLAGVTVALARLNAPDEPRATAMTDETGAWQTRFPESAWQWSVLASKSGYAAVRLWNLRPAETGDTVAPDLVLQPGARIDGTVTDSDGKPVPGLTVRLMIPRSGPPDMPRDGGRGGRDGGGRDGGDPRSAAPREEQRSQQPQPVAAMTAVETNAAGFYEFIDVPPGSLKVGVVSGDYFPVEPMEVVAVAETPVHNVNFTLTKAGVIHGTVRDVNGAPLAGIAVRAQAVLGKAEREAFLRKYDGQHWHAAQVKIHVVKTAADGSYAITGLTREFGFDIVAVATGYEEVSRAGVVADAEVHLTVRPAPLFAIEGTVTDAVTGGPVTGLLRAIHRVSVDGVEQSYEAVSVTVGGYLPGTKEKNPEVVPYQLQLESGKYTLAATADGYQPEILQVEIVGATRIDVKMKPTAAITGIVLDEITRDPVPGIEVFYKKLGAENEQKPKPRGDYTYADHVTTGKDGVFVLTGATDGRYSLIAKGRKYALTYVPIEIREAKPVEDILIEVGVGGTLSGIVRAADGTPAAFVPVTAILDQPELGISENRLGFTDAEGRYSIPHLSELTNKAYAGPTKKDAPNAIAVQLQSNAVTSVDFTLTERVVSGTVGLPGLEAGNLDLQAVSVETGKPVRLKFHVTGGTHFSVFGIQPGAYNLLMLLAPKGGKGGAMTLQPVTITITDAMNQYLPIETYPDADAPAPAGKKDGGKKDSAGGGR